jgi:cytoskeleton protein RodZ
MSEKIASENELKTKQPTTKKTVLKQAPDLILEQVNETPLSIGKMLKTARIQQNISVAEIAQALNLRVTLIHEIENDNFDNISAPTYLKGYLKNYAIKVKISPTELLQQLALQVSTTEVKLQSFSRRTIRENRDQKLTFVSYGIAVGLLLMLIIWWVQDTSLEQVPDFSERTIEEIIAEQAIALEQEQQMKISQADMNQLKPFSETPKSPVISPQSSLSMQLTNDCWMEIRDADGNFLVNGLKKSGYALNIHGKAPFSVVIGAPESVQLEYQGMPVDMTKFQQGQVARFSIPLTQ